MKFTSDLQKTFIACNSLIARHPEDFWFIGYISAVMLYVLTK